MPAAPDQPRHSWLDRAEHRALQGVYIARMGPKKASEVLRRRLLHLLGRLRLNTGEGDKASFFTYDAEESAALETAIYHLLEFLDAQERDRENSGDDYNQLAEKVE